LTRSRPDRAALLALTLIGCLVVLKLVVGLAVVHSAAMISEGVHSGIDMIVAALGYVGIRTGRRPADVTHGFGHGKFEALFALAQGLLILGVGALVLWAAVEKLVHQSPTQSEWAGLLVLAASAAVNRGLAWYLRGVQRSAPSAALLATEHDVRADTITSLAVLVALGLVAFTRLQVIDGIAALAVAALVVRAGLVVLREALHILLDTSLPLAERERIDGVLADHLRQPGLLEFHDVRTRRVGAQRIVEMHAVVAGEMPVEQAHRLCDAVEADLRALWPDAEVTIHVEPPSHRKQGI
jgi:cation diffusion facilitator family transporter